VREPKYALRGDGAISECGPVWEKDARNVTAYMYDRNGYRLFDILYALRFHLWLSQNSGMCAMHVDVPVRACVFNGMDGDESRIFTAYNIEINERCDDRTTDWESTVLCGDRRYRVARYECALISYMDEYGRRSTKVLNEYRDVRMAQHFWDTGRGKRICDARSSEELADDLAAAMVILAKAGARVRDEQQQFIH
jgi:peptide deformylase